MALEVVNFINDLTEANPSAGDPKSEGDDHIRNIKRALKACFPSLTYALPTSAFMAAAGFFDAASLAAARTALGVRASGDTLLLQYGAFQTGAVATGTAVVPFDNTIQQIGEGTEFLELKFTPKFATSILDINVLLSYALSSATPHCIASLFKVGTNDALSTGVGEPRTANAIGSVPIKHKMIAAVATEITFKVRAGPSAAATMTLNGFSAAQKLGGVLVSAISINEIAVV